MSETKERKVGYDVDEEIDGVTCRHSVTHRDSEGVKTKYDVVSIHDFSELSHRALLKLAAMQGKIKQKEDMAIRAHAGETTFEYTWVDADVDGKTRTSKVKEPITEESAMEFALGASDEYKLVAIAKLKASMDDAS